MTAWYCCVTLCCNLTRQSEQVEGLCWISSVRVRAGVGAGPQRGGGGEGGEGGGGGHWALLHVAQAGPVLVGGGAELGQAGVRGERAGGVGWVARHVEGGRVCWSVHRLPGWHPLLVQPRPVAVPPHSLSSLEVSALEHVVVPVGCNSQVFTTKSVQCLECSVLRVFSTQSVEYSECSILRVLST